MEGLGALIGSGILGSLLGRTSPQDEAKAALCRTPEYAASCMKVGHTLGKLDNVLDSLGDIQKSMALACTDAPELLAVTATEFHNLANEAEGLFAEVRTLLAERLTIDPRCKPEPTTPFGAGDNGYGQACAPSGMPRARRSSLRNETTDGPCKPGAYTPGEDQGL